MQLAACLIQEMVEQCSLLRGDSLEVTAVPFQLPAQNCEWNKLQLAVKKKDHAWQKLPGGVAGALARARKRPSTFINVLHPTAGDNWTFESTVSRRSYSIDGTVIANLTKSSGATSFSLDV